LGSGANSFFIAFQLAISRGQFFKMSAKTLFLQPSFRSQRHSFRYLHQSRQNEVVFLSVDLPFDKLHRMEIVIFDETGPIFPIERKIVSRIAGDEQPI